MRTEQDESETLSGVLSSLKLPLLGCGNAYEDFEQVSNHEDFSSRQ